MQYSTLFEADHEAFRQAVKTFIAREVAPNIERWNEQGLIDRSIYRAAGRQGMLGLTIGQEDEPGTLDYRYRVVLCEELTRARAGALMTSFCLQDDVVIPYFADLCTPEQKERWLGKLCSGEFIASIAMTEPEAGSDLRGIRSKAERVAGGWNLHGSKIFISSGIQSDLIVVAARTDTDARAGALTLLVVEADMPGFRRGRKLEKVGLVAQDTAELFFDEVFVPDANVLGTVGEGLRELMRHLPIERLGIAAGAMAGIEAALEWTLPYVKQREAFGQPLARFQNTQFVLAELLTQRDVTRAYFDTCVRAFNEGQLTPVEAAKLKYWTTELQGTVVDACLQLHGGYGYSLEYPIARAYADARVGRIYGGTTEIMKTVIARDALGPDRRS